MLDVGRYLPLSRMAFAAMASICVTEKVFWKPS
jgi:hypothetical protein